MLYTHTNFAKDPAVVFFRGRYFLYHSAVIPGDKRLRIGIADTSDSGSTPHLLKNLFKFGSEGRILDIVDLALKTPLPVPRGHTAPSCSQMGVIVSSKKNVGKTFLSRRDTKKTAHKLLPFVVFPLYSCTKIREAATSVAASFL